MAEKRMFTKKITESDAFLDMPCSTQNLYFHLNMNADDDGFVNNPKRIIRDVSASEDDLKLLIVKKFIIQFESGIIVIKHWWMHNTLMKDRYHETDYLEEKSKLVKKENKVYTTCYQNVNKMLTENRLDKNSKDKNSKDITVAEVIDYLNEKSHKNYKVVESNSKYIKGRLDEGFTVDDFKKVIDIKCLEWLNDVKMDQYLRPQTLFSPNNFQSYLNQGSKKQKEAIPVYKEEDIEW